MERDRITRRRMIFAGAAASQPPIPLLMAGCVAWAGFIEVIQVGVPAFGADAAGLLAMNAMPADVTASIANDAAKLPAGSAVVVEMRAGAVRLSDGGVKVGRYGPVVQQPRKRDLGATLVGMTDTVQRPGPGADDDFGMDPSGRLAAYEARTQTPLDLLALATLWIVVVPATDFSTAHDVRAAVLAVQGAVRLVYAIDIIIRSALARRHVHYLLTHPVAIAAVVLPPVRVIFSLRLVRSVFRRGHLSRFLLAATVLVLNGAAIVYLLERHAPDSSIHTLGESLWWSVTTVTTVGYGDYVPVTAAGRVTACFVMGIGLLTLAVVTAQVASSFVSQEPSRPQGGPPAQPATPGTTLAELDQRLARIEQLLTATTPPPPRAGGAPGPESGGS